MFSTQSSYNNFYANRTVEITTELADLEQGQSEVQVVINELLQTHLIKNIFDKKETNLSKFNPVVVQKYINLINDPIAQAISSSEDIDTQDWHKSYGKLNCETNLIRQKEEQCKEFKNLRQFIASNLKPIGLGFTTKQEYQFFICQYVLTQDPSPHDIHNEDNYISYQIRDKYNKKLGNDVRLLWQIVKEYTSQSLIKLEQYGISTKLPRSTYKLMDTYLCSKKVAQSVIDVLTVLPENPASDIIQFNTNVRRTKKGLSQRQLMMDIDVNQQKQDISWDWSGKIRMEALDISNKVNQRFIKNCDLIIDTQLNAKDLKTTSVNMLSDAVIDKLLDSYLMIMEEDRQIIQNLLKLTPAESQGKNYAINCFDAKVNKLRQTRLKYFNKVRELTDKKRLIEFIINYQSEYLLSDNKYLLKPLSKAYIVKALGYLPSTEYQSGEIKLKKNKLALDGRRVERYLKNSLIKLNGEIIPLEKLIPGHGGVKDNRGEKFTQETIKFYIAKIIEKENKQKPYSDQKLSYLLNDNYGIKLARKTVNKYRTATGILSSQARRGDVEE